MYHHEVGGLYSCVEFKFTLSYGFVTHLDLTFDLLFQSFLSNMVKKTLRRGRRQGLGHPCARRRRHRGGVRAGSEVRSPSQRKAQRGVGAM
jgi:hypothetical protein